MAEITVHDLLTWDARIVLPEKAYLLDPWQSPERSLEREISWAVTLRASAPILPPLRGGELVILPDRILGETDIPVSEIVREVANRGATGLIVERIVPAPTSLVTLWSEVIPPDLESDINRVLTEQRGEIYRAGTDLGRLLTQANAQGAGPDEIVRLAATYLGCGVAVVSTRHGIVAGSDPLIASRVGGLPEEPGWHEDVFAFRISQGGLLWLGPVAASRRALARLVSERIGLAVDAALIHAVDVRPRGSARSHAVGGLLTSSNADAAKIGAALGLPTNGLFAVMLSSAGAERTKQEREIASMGTVYDAAEIDGFRASLIELRKRPSRTTSVERPHTLARIGEAQPVHDRWIVLSESVSGVSQIPVAALQARYLAALVAGGLLSGDVIRFDQPDDVGIYRLLFPLWGSPELESFAHDTLGQLLIRDKRGSLRRTLLTYLESGGSQVEAAARLRVHRNTLSYRLRQIADLTGTDPTRAQSYLALHMALLASVLPPAPDAPEEN